MNVYEEYQKKLVTAAEAVKLVKDGDWVDYSQTCSFPEALDEALAARRDELYDVKVRNAIAMKPIQVVEQDPEHKAFTSITPGTAPAWTGSTWTRAGPTTLPCCSGTAGPTIIGAMLRWMWP